MPFYLMPFQSPVLLGLQSLLRSERASVSVIVAIAGTAVALSSMLAFDMARAHLASGRLQIAVDAAALAATRDVDSPTLEQDMRLVFDANFSPDFLGSTVSKFKVDTVSQNGLIHSISLTVGLELPSPIAAAINAAGGDFLSLETRAVTERRTRGAEVAMVLDNSKSMQGADIKDLKTASHNLLDIMFNGRESVPNLYVAIVPFTGTVNIGQQNQDWLRSLAANPLPPDSFLDYWPAEWKGCVFARSAPYDETDDPPNVRGFDPQFWPSSKDAKTGAIDQYHNEASNVWHNEQGSINEDQGILSHGPNLGCGSPIVPLTASYSELTTAVENLEVWHRGGKMANFGLVWGWRSLSPKWRDLWRRNDGALIVDRPKDYTQASNRKVIVIMSDGPNEWWRQDLTTYGRYDVNTLNGEHVDDRLMRTCDEIKNHDITIFAITFGPGHNQYTRDLYRACSSEGDIHTQFPGSKYWHAPTYVELEEAFANVAGQLTELRIIQ